MKLLSFLLFSFITTQLVVGQNTMKPIVNASYMYSYPIDRLLSHELQIGGGVQFNDHLSLQLNVRGIQNARGISNNTIKEPLQIITVSLSPSCRFLKRNYIVSPVLAMDAGTELWSNGFGRYVDQGFEFRENSGYTHYLYRKGVFFGRAKILADFRVWDFNLLIGASFNMYYFKLDSDIYSTKAIGLEGTVMYTFPMKKRAAKATSGGE